MATDKRWWSDVSRFGEAVGDLYKKFVLIILVISYIIIFSASVWLRLVIDTRAFVIGAFAIALVFVERMGSIRKSLEEISRNILNINSQIKQNIFNYNEATHQLFEGLRELPPKSSVSLDIIGQSLVKSKIPLMEYMAQAKVKHLNIRILILSPEKTKLEPSAPHEVRDWSDIVPGTLRQLNECLTGVEKAARREKRHVRVEVKEYSNLPSVHGFRVTEPFPVWYISFCRWRTGPNLNHVTNLRDVTFYDYADEFHKIDRAFLSDSEVDLIRIYDGMFSYCWNRQPESLIDFDSDGKK